MQMKIGLLLVFCVFMSCSAWEYSISASHISRRVTSIAIARNWCNSYGTEYINDSKLQAFKDNNNNIEDENLEEDALVIKATFGIINLLSRDLLFFDQLRIRVIYFVALQYAVLRGDWLFISSFLGTLAITRKAEAPDGAALVFAVFLSGIISPLLEDRIHFTSFDTVNFIFVIIFSIIATASLQPESDDFNIQLPEEKTLEDIRERKMAKKISEQELNAFDSRFENKTESFK